MQPGWPQALTAAHPPQGAVTGSTAPPSGPQLSPRPRFPVTLPSRLGYLSPEISHLRGSHTHTGTRPHLRSLPRTPRPALRSGAAWILGHSGGWGQRGFSPRAPLRAGPPREGQWPGDRLGPQGTRASGRSWTAAALPPSEGPGNRNLTARSPPPPSSRRARGGSTVASALTGGPHVSSRLRLSLQTPGWWGAGPGARLRLSWRTGPGPPDGRICVGSGPRGRPGPGGSPASPGARAPGPQCREQGPRLPWGSDRPPRTGHSANTGKHGSKGR